MRNNILLAVFAGLAVLATAAAGQQPNGEIQREKMTERAEGDDQTQNADFTGSQRSSLESELKKADYKTESRRKRVPTSAQTNLNSDKLSHQMQALSQNRRPQLSR
jgi:hypothetical protein